MLAAERMQRDMLEAGIFEQAGRVERVVAADPGDEPDASGVEPEARTRDRIETAAAHLTHPRAGCGWDDIVDRHLAEDDQIGGVARCQGLQLKVFAVSRTMPFAINHASSTRRRGM